MTGDPKPPKAAPGPPRLPVRKDPPPQANAANPGKPPLPRKPILPRPGPRLDGTEPRKATPRPMSLPLPRPASRSGSHPAVSQPPVTPKAPEPAATSGTEPRLQPGAAPAQEAAAGASLADLLSETLSVPPPAPPADADLSSILSAFATPTPADANADDRTTPITPLPPTVRGSASDLAEPPASALPTAPPPAPSEPDADLDLFDLPELDLHPLDEVPPSASPPRPEDTLDADAETLGIEMETLEKSSDAGDSWIPLDADAFGATLASEPPTILSEPPTILSEPPVAAEPVGGPRPLDVDARDLIDLVGDDGGHDADEIDGEPFGIDLASVPAPPGSGAATTEGPVAVPEEAVSASAAPEIELGAEEFDPNLLDMEGSEKMAPAVLGSTPEGITRAARAEDLDDDDDRPTFVPDGYEPAEIRAPASLVPPATADERPAAAVLGAQQLTRTWTLRAERFETLANAAQDVNARSRLLLVASELWAMVGELERARAAARKASQAAPGVGILQRQTRMLAALTGDWKVAGAQLDAEARAAPTPEARAHAAYVSAEIRRLTAHDDEQARRRLDLVRRVWPGDPRPAVFGQVTELLGGPPAPPGLSNHPTLAVAARVVARLRGGAPLDGDARSPALSLADAEHHLAGRDVSAALDALGALEGSDGLADAVLWLTAALAAPLPAERPRAVAALRRLLQAAPEPSVRCALAARALELGDAEALAEALADTDGPFSPLDRVALAALTGAPPETLGTALAALAVAPDGPALATAVARSLSPTADLAAGGAPGRAADVLGRQLALAPSLADASAALEAFAAEHPGSAVSAVLGVEQALAGGAHVAAAQQLSGSPEDRSGAMPLVFGVLAERAGATSEAVAYYRSGLTSSAFGEAAARALASLDPSEASSALRAAAEALPQGSERHALLLYEAALRLERDAPADALPLALAAARAAPHAVPIHRLADHLCRRLGDVGELVSLLQQRQAVADDPVEQALDAIREALLVADTDPARAASLLTQAVRVRPEDVALRELGERMNPTASRERGAWREDAATRLEATEPRSALLLEAALEYERAGDLPSAAHAAHEAAEQHPGPLARVVAERLAPFGSRAAAVRAERLERARAGVDPTERAARYEQLIAFDTARGDVSATLAWHRALLEQAPGHVASLRALEHAALTEGRAEELEGLATELVGVLEPREAAAHGALAARLRGLAHGFAERAVIVEAVLQRTGTALWALRDRAALAEISGDPTARREAYAALLERADGPLDIAALCLRAAEAAATLGDDGAAITLLDHALEAAPDHVIARSARAALCERAGAFDRAAEDLEIVGAESHGVAARVSALRHAGALWFDRAGDPDRAIASLERTAALSPDDTEIFDRLQLAYVRTGKRAALADLLQRRLERTSDPQQRLALELTLGQALAEAGNPRAARAALDAALEAEPEHAGALESYAELSLREGDHGAAERAFIRLARVCTDREQQTRVYRRLAELYTRHLPNPQRAERCYREVLKRHPEDEGAAADLVSVYVELKDTENAARLQTQLVERAQDAALKRDRLVKLSGVYEHGGNRKAAAAVLDKARKAWPQDPVVLRASVALHQRHGEAAAAKILLDRTANEARRALTAGRFEVDLFATLATVAELRGDAGAAQLSQTTLAALQGMPAETLPGTRGAADDPALDDVLAPSTLSPALRSLVHKLAGVLDAAFPVDLRGLRAAPPGAQAPWAQEIRALATRMGIQGLELLVSPALGPTCLPASATPPRLVIGQALLDARDDGARRFALVRGLKLLQSQGAALTRLEPSELGPALAALLATFARDWQPQGLDPERLAEARRRIESARLPRVDDDVPFLALEVAGALGDRAVLVALGYRQFSNRAALLATGDLDAALRALGIAAGPDGPLPDTGPDRLAWIARHDEARDLVLFSVSDACAEAQRSLGS
jgi:cellulose synthase operon protein C